ncbi:MAG: glycoside hydrolase family 57 protein, partial [Thermodesulfovibrionaceae bacterium]
MSINLAILWHMHQPYYFDPIKGKFMLPWVRLHATKDYLDMLLILKEFPEVKVTFNLVPSLIKQLKEYEKGSTDIFLEYTLIPADELTEEQRIFILENFFLANWKTMIEPFPRYRQLLEKRGRSFGDLAKRLKEFSPQDFRDLQLLFNLVWIDPLHRDKDPFLKDLIKKGENFTEEEKKLVIEKQFEIIKKIIPTYKEMAISGQIELTVSPFYHPILPLVYDIFISKKCMPEVVLPRNHFCAPEDAEAQIRKAIDYFEEVFGFKPKGLWPSEGSVSEEVLRLIKRQKIEWIATDEEILSKTIEKNLRVGDSLIEPKKLYQVYDFEGLKIFFRDRVLSDLIGFVYHSWSTEQAVSDFICRIRKAPSGSIISVILDGENAWEYYENDGLDFLRRFYEFLQKDKFIRTVTFSEYLKENTFVKSLQKIFPGSWIGANFSIWIGHEEDNTAWDYLYKVRQDLVVYQRENPQKGLMEAWEEIYIAEGSDWNWWYGDEHYTETKEVFDEIYRDHLISIYLKIGKEPPAFLYVPITKKLREIKPEIEPKGFIYPKIDGIVTGYFEWLEAGRFNLQRIGGSMHKSEGLFSYLYYGFNRESLFLRIDPYKSIEDIEELKVVIQILEPKRLKIVCEDLKKPLAMILEEEENKWFRKDEVETLAFKDVFEIEIPFE